MILKRYSGIPRILQTYSEDCFHFIENFIRIILPISQHFTQTATQDGGNNGGLQLTDRQKVIIELIRKFGGNNGGLTVENIANKLGVSKRTIERDLSTLQKANIIRHSKSRSKGFWELIE